MFWVQNENDIDSTLMFRGVVKSIYPKSRTFFLVSCSVSEEVHNKNKLGGSKAGTGNPN